jgi:hypothetical protein
MVTYPEQEEKKNISMVTSMEFTSNLPGTRTKQEHLHGNLQGIYLGKRQNMNIS